MIDDNDNFNNNTNTNAITEHISLSNNQADNTIPSVNTNNQNLNNTHTNKQIINNININQNPNPNSILVNFEQDLCKFTLYDPNMQLLGSFTSDDVIKYIKNENITITYAIPLIEKYICIVSKKNETLDIELLDHIKSPFTGNLEMMLNLYCCICKNKDNENNSDIRGFIYLLLNHILRLISTISDCIKHDNSQIELKHKLMKYTIYINHKISNIIKFDIDKNISNYKKIQEDLVRIGKIKLDMYEKIDKISHLINKQNKQLDILISELNTESNITSNIITSSDNDGYKYTESNSDINNDKEIFINNLSDDE